MSVLIAIAVIGLPIASVLSLAAGLLPKPAALPAVAEPEVIVFDFADCPIL